MDDKGRVERKPPSPKPARAKGDYYNKRGSLQEHPGHSDPQNLEYAVPILEKLAAAFEREVHLEIVSQKFGPQVKENDTLKITSSQALSMVEEVRMILSPILDRKV